MMRKVYGLMGWGSGAYLLASFYLQVAQGLSPCPLCIMQRLCMTVFFVFTLIGCYRAVWRLKKWFLLGQGVWLLGGLFFSGRQVWLQTLPPDRLTTCLPEFKVLMTYFSWSDVLKVLLLGGSDCAHTTFYLAGLSLAAWSLCCFLGLALCLLLHAWQIRTVKH